MSKTANKEISVDMDEVKEAQIYEIGYLLVPTLGEEELPKAYGDLKAMIENMGGLIIFDEMPKFINLAYPMLKVVSNVRNHFDTAYFGWIKFELPAEKIADIKKKLDTDVNTIRFLIIKTVRENTISQKKFISKDSFRRKSIQKDTPSEPIEINKEELDKEIDAMIIEE